MSNPFTLKSAVNFTEQFIDRICKEAYRDKEAIPGPDLPKITPFREFNFILLYILLQSWKNDSKKLRSPYFDFTHEEVRQALKEFMNVLSNHISIREEDFRPLAKKSYQLTLLYFNDVLGFLSEVFTDKVSEKELKELNKYIKSDALDAIMDFMKEEKEKELLISDIELDASYFPEKENFLKLLQDFLALDNAPRRPGGETDKKARVNDAYEEEKAPTVHQSLNQTKTQKTVLESFSESQPPGSIRSKIKLNEQLLITKAIFDGDKEDYAFFIDSLDNASDNEQAIKILNSNVSPEKNLVQYEFLKSLITARFRDTSNS